MSRRFDVKANREQERTGGKGTMADTEYDIHCPEMGGPTWKLNYLSDSCKLRKASGCKKCKKTKPKVPVKANLRKNKINDKSIRKCACCEDIKKINGRELCGKCYGIHRYNGTLHLYPKSRVISEGEWS